MAGWNAKMLKANNIRSRIDNDLDLPDAINQSYIADQDTLTAVKVAGYFLVPITDGNINTADTITVVTGTEASPVFSVGSVSAAGTFTETV